MALTPEGIEILGRDRKALSRGKRGETVAPISIGMEPPPQRKSPRVVVERNIEGKVEHLVAVPETLILPRGLGVLGVGDIFAKRVRFEYNSVRGTQCRKGVFTPFVLCQEKGLFLPIAADTGKGSQRLAWQQFDLWLVFNGGKVARRRLKALGVSFG